MWAAIIRDITESVYECNLTESKKFEFLGPRCAFTDGTVCTGIRSAAREWSETQPRLDKTRRRPAVGSALPLPGDRTIANVGADPRRRMYAQGRGNCHQSAFVMPTV